MQRNGTITANGRTPAVLTKGAYTVHLGGDFGGASVQLQFKTVAGDWVSYDPTKYLFTSNIDILMKEVDKREIALLVTDAGTTSIYWDIGIGTISPT